MAVVRKLEERILKDGRVYPGNVLKIDTFLNHQVDTQLLGDMAEEFCELFCNCDITKVFTIEASGIAIATPVAQLLRVPLVFAKKAQSINLGDDLYATPVKSYTHKRTYDVIVAKYVLNADDRVLIIDDFLANGCALNGLLGLVEKADATVEGIGIAVEKGFQPGGAELRKRGYNLKSLAIVEELNEDNGMIRFRKQ